jgi:hypothetical protein
MGSAAPDVLLYNPLESAWINTSAAMLDEKVWDILEGRNDGSRIHVINKSYTDAINELTDARIEFLIGDRFYLKQMEVGSEKPARGSSGAKDKEARLVRGQFSFRTLVLPPLDILTLEAARKMVEFAKAGGYVYALGELPAASAENGMDDPAMKDLMAELKTAPEFHALTNGLKAGLEDDVTLPGLASPVWINPGEFKLLQQHRRIDGKDFYWLANNTEQARKCDISIRPIGAASIWDCETGTIRPITSVSCGRIELTFKPLEAYWLVVDPALPAREVPAPPESKEALTITGPWKVTYEAKHQPVMEYPVTPPAEFSTGMDKPLEDWQAWVPAKFSGLLEYANTITVDKVEPRDLGKVCHAAEVWVNGQPCGARLWGPYVFDIGKAMRPGNNEIRVRVANLVNNSYGDLREAGLLGPVVLRQGTAR